MRNLLVSSVAMGGGAWVKIHPLFWEKWSKPKNYLKFSTGKKISPTQKILATPLPQVTLLLTPHVH